MSEMARSHLTGIASILTGGTELTFQKDQASGVYWPTYRSTSCGNPNLSKEEAARVQEKAERATLGTLARALNETQEEVSQEKREYQALEARMKAQGHSLPSIPA